MIKHFLTLFLIICASVLNDYKNQQQGQAAPKDLLTLPPLLAMHQILQHVLPPYFQKCRYYGLHATATAKSIAEKLPQKIANNSKTIKTLMQIIGVLTGIDGFPCKACGGIEWTEQEIQSDKDWIKNFIVIPNQRGDPMQIHRIAPNTNYSLL